MVFFLRSFFWFCLIMAVHYFLMVYKYGSMLWSAESWGWFIAVEIFVFWTLMAVAIQKYKRYIERKEKFKWK